MPPYAVAVASRARTSALSDLELTSCGMRWSHVSRFLISLPSPSVVKKPRKFSKKDVVVAVGIKETESRRHALTLIEPGLDLDTALYRLLIPVCALAVMSTISGPSGGPGQILPVRSHIKQRGSVPSHLMRFFRHIEHALVLGGIVREDECRIGDGVRDAGSRSRLGSAPPATDL